MRRWPQIAVLLCLVAACLTGAILLRSPQDRERVPPIRRTPPAAVLPLKGVMVILDPGHGGADPGAKVRWGRGGIDEAALTYRTASELARTLQAAGAEVSYTVRSKELNEARESVPIPERPLDAVLVSTDRPLRVRIGRSPRQLWQRAASARRAWKAAVHADPHASRDVFFLSLHYDDFHDASIHGGLVCVDRRAGPPCEFGIALARALVRRNWNRSDISQGHAGLSMNSLGVLNPAYNPVPQKALLEVATISNMDDYVNATDPMWRGQVAEAITEVIEQVHAQR